MTQEEDPPREIAIRTDADLLVEINSVVKNTKHDILVITTAKAELVLTQAWKRIQRSNDWVTPLALLLPIGLAVLTAEFDAHFGFPGDMWRAVFLVGAVVCTGWLGLELFRWINHDGRLNPKKVVDLLLADGTPWPVVPVAPSPRPDAAASPGPGSPEGKAVSTTGPPPRETASPADRPGAVVAEPRRQSSPISVSDQPHAGTQEATVNGAGHSEGEPKLSPGNQVRHRNFGIGTVLAIVPGSPRFLEVRFDDPDVGTKRLREDLAPLWQVGDTK